MLIYAVEHGDDFAEVAGRATVLGIISSVAFCVYAFAALRWSPAPALIASGLVFALGTLAFSAVEPPLAVSAPVTLLVIGAGSWLVGRLAGVPPVSGPRGDLLAWRLAITAALVVALTAAA